MKKIAGFGNPLRHDRLFWVLAISMLLIRVVYFWTFPFLIEGDGYDYFQLLDSARSNLLHATGYVFLSLIPYRIAESLAADPASLLRYWQQMMSASGALVLYLALKRVVPRWIAFLVGGAIGLDLQMTSAADTTRVEFLQATILMFLISVAVFGFTAETNGKKAFFCTAAGVLAMAGYLTKYNSICTFALCAVPLFDPWLTWRARGRNLVFSGAAAFALLLFFLTSFHYPTTGTFHLNLEHGWIYILKLQQANIPIIPENGIATQKYILLSENLPRVPAAPGYWNSLDEVAPEIRAPFRKQWMGLRGSRDPHYVRSLLDQLPAQDQRKADYYAPETFCSVYYHLGLKEGEDLLKSVLLEGVRSYPSRYLSNVWSAFRQGGNFPEHYWLNVPVPGFHNPSTFFEDADRSLLSPRSRVVRISAWSSTQAKELAAQIWYPGAAFLSYFSFLRVIPPGLVWLVVLAGLVPLAVSVMRFRQFRPTELFFTLLLLVLLAEMVFSAILFGFRSKELTLCQPLIYSSVALSFCMWMKWLKLQRSTGVD